MLLAAIEVPKVSKVKRYGVPVPLGRNYPGISWVFQMPARLLSNGIPDLGIFARDNQQSLGRLKQA